MRVVKKINNNVAICVDDHHHELIAFGKGIGFPQTPYELEDLNRITRTYYGVNASYYGLLMDIPEEIFELSSRIVDDAYECLDKELNPNIVFTLADHIHFAVQRYEKHMHFQMPLAHDIQYLDEKGMQVGEKALEYICQVKQIRLPKEEAIGIAMHLINSENTLAPTASTVDNEQIIADITRIIEKAFALTIDQKGFNYSRFVTHMHYLLKRKDENSSIQSANQRMFEEMVKEYRQTYDCVCKISDYLWSVLGWNPTQEELLYLMLHVNRLCSREDCNR